MGGRRCVSKYVFNVFGAGMSKVLFFHSLIKGFDSWEVEHGVFHCFFVVLGARRWIILFSVGFNGFGNWEIEDVVCMAVPFV